jgi:leader peptidase (prepilin peptidase) / N-methyltransferase
MNLLSLFIPVILGLLAGYLVNYVSDVLPFTRRFSQPNCPNCSTPFSWKDYLLLQACRSCGHKRSVRTYLVLLVMLAATVYFWIDPPVRIGFLLSYILLVYLGVVFVIDLEHRLIMHPVSITGAILGLGIGSYANGLVPTLLGGAFGFGSMLLLYYLGEVFTRYMSKRRGEPVDEVALGFGDVNLCGVTGLLLGWPVILAGILFTIFAGGIGSILVIAYMLIRKRYNVFTPIPYAPFLIFSVLFYLFR